MLDPDITLRADDAAVQIGAPRAMRGAAAVAARSIGGAAATQLALLDGAVGRVWGGSPRMVFDFTITDEKIVAIDLVADPDRLRHIDIVVLDH